MTNNLAEILESAARRKVSQFIDVAEPFGDYADFDDCVSKNQDKDDPAAFCGFLKKRLEGEMA